MEIDGWQVRTDQDGNILRWNLQDPKVYLITVLNRYAIDIKLIKEEVDKIPKDQLHERLVSFVKEAISKVEKPFFEGNT